MPIDTTLIRSLSFFKSLPDSSINLLIEHTSTKHFDKDQVIYFHGDPVDSFYIIHQGWIKCTHNTIDGNESIHQLLTTGDSFGESVFLSENAHYSSNAETLCPCDLYVIPARIIRQATANDQTLAMHLLATITKHKSTMELQIEHLHTMSAPQRIGCFLLKLCRNVDTNSIKAELPYDKSVISSYLGMKPETFSRGLQKLREIGVEIDHHTIQIGHIDALQEFSCVSCSNPLDCDEE